AIVRAGAAMRSAERRGVGMRWRAGPEEGSGAPLRGALERCTLAPCVARAPPASTLAALAAAPERGPRWRARTSDRDLVGALAKLTRRPPTGGRLFFVPRPGTVPHQEPRPMSQPTTAPAEPHPSATSPVRLR